jgi:hypothetical protein
VPVFFFALGAGISGLTAFRFEEIPFCYLGLHTKQSRCAEKSVAAGQAQLKVCRHIF